MGILGRVKKGLVFVISAPSGAGKTTLVEKLIAEYPLGIKRSISCTTRAKRGLEEEGVDYFFLSEADFQKRIEEGAFLEYTKVFNRYYGTLKKTVDQSVAKGEHVILVIDTEGALKLQKLIEAVFIFIEPPSLEVLKQRLQKRHTEDQEAVDLRLSCAEEEMSKAKYYDYKLLNDDLEKAYIAFKGYIMQKEKQRCDYL